MSRNKRLALQLGVATVSLAAAVAVYFFTRIDPPAVIGLMRAADFAPASQVALLGSAPSFLYTLAIGLLIGICAANRKSAWNHCLAWTMMVLTFELLQQNLIAKPVASFLADRLYAPAWALVEPYLNRGVFDPLDLIATALGGAIALYLLSELPTEARHDVPQA